MNQLKMTSDQLDMLNFLGLNSITTQDKLRRRYAAKGINAAGMAEIYDGLKKMRLAGNAKRTTGATKMPRMEYWLTDKGRAQYKAANRREPV